MRCPINARALDVVFECPGAQTTYCSGPSYPVGAYRLLIPERVKPVHDSHSDQIGESFSQRDH